MTGPFYWACAQIQYGTRLRVCMGLGSPRRTIGTGPGACMGPRPWYRTILGPRPVWALDQVPSVRFLGLKSPGLQFICSGLEDFLLWVVLGRETRNNAQLILTLLTIFSLIFSTLSSPNFLLYIAKVSGKIMITATVCAIEGPISFDSSGCLGERAVLHL